MGFVHKFKEFSKEQKLSFQGVFVESFLNLVSVFSLLKKTYMYLEPSTHFQRTILVAIG